MSHMPGGVPGLSFRFVTASLVPITEVSDELVIAPEPQASSNLKQKILNYKVANKALFNYFLFQRKCKLIYRKLRVA